MRHLSKLLDGLEGYDEEMESRTVMALANGM